MNLHPKQAQAFLSDSKITICTAGVQSGKTTVATFWMLRQMQKWHGKDHAFIIACPTYRIMQQSTLPTFLKYAHNFGTYKKGDEQFILHSGAPIYFRTSTNPWSIEGIQNVRAIWCDEAGMMPYTFWVNAEGRVARTGAPIICTTTPYGMNWPYTHLIKPAKEGLRPDVSHYEWISVENPSFPREEYDRQRQILDPRTFRRKYMGISERMEGLVYELPSDVEADPISLPKQGRNFAGVDWGFTEGHEFAVVVRRIALDGFRYEIDEFKASGMDPNQQIEICRQKHKLYNIELFLCDPSRPDMIAALNKAGIPARGFHVGVEAYKPLIAGITEHTALIRSGRYKILKGKLPNLMDEYETYHWPETAEDKPAKEAPVKMNDHILDCLTSDSLISTSRGEIPICDIKRGDLCHTRLGLRRVTDAWSVGIRPCLRLSFSNGSELQCTANHLIYTLNRGWTAAECLTYDDILWTQNESTSMVLPISAIRNRSVEALGFILCAARTTIQKGLDIIIEIFIDPFMALSQKDLSFITRMETLSIMPSKTWRPFAPKNICRTTAKRCFQSLERWKNNASIWIKSGILPLDGTDLKRVESGIRNMHRFWHRLLDRKPRTNVINAENPTRLRPPPFVQDWRSTVTTDAKTKRATGDIVTLVCRSEIGSHEVWDMTVEEAHEFYANGVLVHNCARMLTVGTMNIKIKAPAEPYMSRTGIKVDRFDPRKKSRATKRWDSF